MFSDELTHQAESTTFPLLSLLIQRALCGVEPFAALIHEGAACLVAEPAAYLAYLAYLVWLCMVYEFPCKTMQCPTQLTQIGLCPALVF